MVQIVPMIRYAEPNNWSGGDYNKTIIVIHATVTPERHGGARQVGGWFNDPGFDASTQYVVDDSEIVQSAPETAYAWSAGTTANQRGIHIELVAMPGQTRSQWNDVYSDAELRLAAELTAELCAKHQIRPRKIGPAEMRADEDGICGHDDVRDAWGETTHWDPGPHFPWDRFINLVNHYFNPQEDDMPYRDWSKEDRQSLARDVAAELLSTVIDRKEGITVSQALRRSADHADRQYQATKRDRDEAGDASPRS